MTNPPYLSQIQSIRPSSLPDQIYQQLRAAILTGELPPGQRLIELDIANRTGTSQGPVREALQRLENDGLVERQARSGTFVTGNSSQDIRELFQIRSLVEKFAIRRTAQAITPQQCDELQALVEAMRTAAGSDDMLELAAQDLEFHRRICTWSGNKSLVSVWLPLYSQIQRYLTQNHRHHFASLKIIADLHQPVVDVLRKGDAEQAGQVIEDHILLTMRS